MELVGTGATAGDGAAKVMTCVLFYRSKDAKRQRGGVRDLIDWVVVGQVFASTKWDLSGLC